MKPGVARVTSRLVITTLSQTVSPPLLPIFFLLYCQVAEVGQVSPLSLQRDVFAWELGNWNTFALLFLYISTTFLLIFCYFSATFPLLFATFPLLFCYFSTTLPLIFHHCFYYFSASFPLPSFTFPQLFCYFYAT